MNVAIVGAGWAGLAAALRLQSLGHPVTIYEAGRIAGGRARRVAARAWNGDIDNGQHLLLGAYTDTLAIMKSLGLDIAQHFYRCPLNWQSVDGRIRLQAPTWPAGQASLAVALLRGRGWSWADKLAVIKALASLRAKQWRSLPGLTVAAWLQQHHQPDAVIETFWRPLCIAALNTPLDEACMQLFAAVLRDSVGANAGASDFLIPRVDLSALWPDRAIEHLQLAGGQVHFGRAVRQLSLDSEHVLIDGQEYDAAVIAANAASTLRLLRGLPAASADQHQYLDQLAAFTYRPIATLSLKLQSPWQLPAAMLMLTESRADDCLGQWLFSSGTLGRDPDVVHIVISDAANLIGRPSAEICEAVVRQINAQAARRYGALPPVLAHELIIEKRATFAALPGLSRPANDTPWLRIWTAGDWTDTGYPAVLEGAVRSGQRAAQEIHASFTHSARRAPSHP